MGPARLPLGAARTITEDWIAGGIKRPAAKESMAQAPGIGVLGVRDPRTDAGCHLGVGHGFGMNPVAQAAPAIAKPADVILGQTPAIRRKDIP